MDDYISKPVDDILLYNKITDLLKKPLAKQKTTGNRGRTKYVDLTYLYKRTKTNTGLMMEMIELYLEQTPSLINTIKQSSLEKDWNSLYAAIHKVIPSFSIMGINREYEEIAKKIQEYAGTKQHLDEIDGLIIKNENVCLAACRELKKEYNLIKKSYHG